MSRNSVLYVYPSTNCPQKVCDFEALNEITGKAHINLKTFESDYMRAPMLIVPRGDSIEFVSATSEIEIRKGLCEAGYFLICEE